MCIAGQFKGQPLRINKEVPERRHYLQVLSFLTQYGQLRGLTDFRSNSLFALGGRTNLLPEEAICTADPFAYLSHLTAMEFHGLTDRLPETIYVSSPPPNDWRAFAQNKKLSDLKELVTDYENSGFPTLYKPRPTRVLGKRINLHNSLHFGAFKNVPSTKLRYSTIGRTFFDMLSAPSLCGGLRHVLNVYAQHAKKFLPLIVTEIDRHGSPIDKVRAGYVLEEVCGLVDPKIDDWRAYVQRGGSRKLSAAGEYSPTYSEKWCLSINID